MKYVFFIKTGVNVFLGQKSIKEFGHYRNDYFYFGFKLKKNSPENIRKRLGGAYFKNTPSINNNSEIRKKLIDVSAESIMAAAAKNDSADMVFCVIELDAELVDALLDQNKPETTIHRPAECIWVKYGIQYMKDHVSAYAPPDVVEIFRRLKDAS